MKITEFSPEEFDKLEKAWKCLEKGIEMSWFQTYDWYKIINKHFMAEKKKAPFRFGTYVLLSDDEDKPLMIAPIQVVKTGLYVKGIGLRKGFYFIGRQGFSDYLNFIYDNFEDSYLDSILNYVKTKYKMNFFCFENVSCECKSYTYFETKNLSAKLDSLCMRICLPDNFETYKKSLSKNMRHNIRKGNNHAETDGLKLHYEIVRKIDNDMAKQLESIRLQRLGKKRTEMFEGLSSLASLYVKSRELLVKFTSKPVEVMEEVEDCWVLLAKDGDRIAAFFYSVYKPEIKTIYTLRAGVDVEYERYKPGITQLMAFVEDNLNSDEPEVFNIDLTRGNDSYKYDLKAKEIVTSQFDLYM